MAQFRKKQKNGRISNKRLQSRIPTVAHLPAGLRDFLIEEAEKRDTSVSYVMCEAIEIYRKMRLREMREIRQGVSQPPSERLRRKEAEEQKQKQESEYDIYQRHKEEQEDSDEYMEAGYTDFADETSMPKNKRGA